MHPPEYGGVEARLQFIQCPIVGRSRQAVRYNRDDVVLNRGMNHLIRLYQQEPVADLDGQLLATVLAVRQQLQETLHVVAGTLARGRPLGENSAPRPVDRGRE